MKAPSYERTKPCIQAEQRYSNTIGSLYYTSFEQFGRHTIKFYTYKKFI